jgi:hypothetical protein
MSSPLTPNSGLQLAGPFGPVLAASVYTCRPQAQMGVSHDDTTGSSGHSAVVDLDMSGWDSTFLEFVHG